MAARFSNHINIKNRQASYRYALHDRYVAGLALKGTEIKSIREGQANLQDSYCHFDGHELYVKNMRVAPYAQTAYYNHEPTRMRKLLLKKTELRRLLAKSSEKGFSIIPLRLFINNRGYAKLEIALARGKKNYDKREQIRDRDLKKELGRLTYR